MIKNKIESTDNLGFKIQLYIAEYNTLTNRSTYYYYINNMLLTAMVAGAATLVGNLTGHEYLTWGLILGIQVVALFTAVITYENYLIIYYLESQLIPQVARILAGAEDDEMWAFEKFLLKKRRTTFFLKAEATASLGYLVFLLLCIFVFKPPGSGLDFYAYGSSAIGFVAYIKNMYKCYQLRKNKWGTVN